MTAAGKTGRDFGLKAESILPQSRNKFVDDRPPEHLIAGLHNPTIGRVLGLDPLGRFVYVAADGFDTDETQSLLIRCFRRMNSSSRYPLTEDYEEQGFQSCRTQTIPQGMFLSPPRRLGRPSKSPWRLFSNE